MANNYAVNDRHRLSDGKVGSNNMKLKHFLAIKLTIRGVNNIRGKAWRINLSESRSDIMATQFGWV